MTPPQPKWSFTCILLLLVLHYPLQASGRCVGPCGNTTCLDATGTQAPCGPNAQRCGPPFSGDAPLFHLRDDSCGNNDPNAPFYDASTGLYHLQYQAQLAIPQNLSQFGFTSYGPVIGHAISADLVHWAHLPVAFWNDEPFRNLAVFTGSATVVNGVPHLVYPGVCGYASWTACSTYFLATPANRGDPLLRDWQTVGVIANSTGDDPSGAWQTADGSEWRFVGSRGTVYWTPSSTGFLGPWNQTPDQVFLPPTYNATDGGISCGDLFPRPRDCDAGGVGCGPAPNATPTHMYKLLIHGPNGLWGTGSGQVSWVSVTRTNYFDSYPTPTRHSLRYQGNYTDGAPGSGGIWSPIPFNEATPLRFSAPTSNRVCRSCLCRQVLLPIPA